MRVFILAASLLMTAAVGIGPGANAEDLRVPAVPAEAPLVPLKTCVAGTSECFDSCQATQNDVVIWYTLGSHSGNCVHGYTEGEVNCDIFYYFVELTVQNDDYESVEVVNGCDATTYYQHEDFEGLRDTCLNSCSSLGTLDNRVSSYVVCDLSGSQCPTPS